MEMDAEEQQPDLDRMEEANNQWNRKEIREGTPEDVEGMMMMRPRVSTVEDVEEKRTEGKIHLLDIDIMMMNRKMRDLEDLLNEEVGIEDVEDILEMMMRVKVDKREQVLVEMQMEEW